MLRMRRITSRLRRLGGGCRHRASTRNRPTPTACSSLQYQQLFFSYLGVLAK